MDRGDCTFCDIWRCLQNSAKTENVSQNFYLSPLRMIGSLDCRGQGLTTSRGNTLTITGSHEKSDMETPNWRSREEPGWAGDTETVRLTSQAVMKGIVWFSWLLFMASFVAGSETMGLTDSITGPDTSSPSPARAVRALNGGRGGNIVHWWRSYQEKWWLCDNLKWHLVLIAVL